jgi:hypothetical protein
VLRRGTHSDTEQGPEGKAEFEVCGKGAGTEAKELLLLTRQCFLEQGQVRLLMPPSWFIAGA